MSNEEIISVIDELALGAEECANDYDYTGRARKAHARKAKALRVAIEKLRTHQDAQPNGTLTLDELREMDGMLVWIVGASSINNFKGNWDICEWVDEESITFPHCMEGPDLKNYGITWKAYRRPPKAALERREKEVAEDG